jgi:RimJ/RimL family protein N-acetyltransferase
VTKAEIPTWTDRICLRPYRLADDAEVAEMFADPRARRFYPDMAGPDKAAGWIQWNLDNYATYGFGLWVIEHREAGSFLGDCRLTYQHVETQRMLEVGYHVQEQHRGRGYATEAGRACIAYAFDELDAPLVCSILDPANTVSLAVAARLHASRRTFTKADGQRMWLYWSERTSTG